MIFSNKILLFKANILWFEGLPKVIYFWKLAGMEYPLEPIKYLLSQFYMLGEKKKIPLLETF